jgi:hypothetical protein
MVGEQFDTALLCACVLSSDTSQVRAWLRQHNQTVLQEPQTGNSGVRIIPCWLPTKSPWLNRIEPKWVHGKRAIVEPARLLTAQEVKQRICDYFD